MIKVLILSQVPPPVHGSTVMTQTLVEVLSRKGIEHELVSRQFSKTVKQIGKIRLGKLTAAINLIRRMKKNLSRFQPDVVIFFATNRALSFLMDLLLLRFISRRSIPIVMYFHTAGYSELAARSPVWSWLVKKYLNYAVSFVVLADTLGDELHGLSPSRRIYRVPNTLSFDVLIEKKVPLVERSPRTIVFLSNLIPEKGAFDFLDLAESAHRKRLNLDFILAGSPGPHWYMGELNQRLESASGSIAYIGELGREQVSELLSKASALVFPSSYPYEAQPLVLIEALAFGTPIVAYSVGSVPQMLHSGGGKVVKSGDQSALFEVLIELTTDDVEWNRISNSAIENFRKNFSQEAFASSWIEILSSFDASAEL